LVTKVNKGGKNSSESDTESENSVSDDEEIIESSEEEQSEDHDDKHVDLFETGQLQVMQPQS
jgi:hypothetical protein